MLKPTPLPRLLTTGHAADILSCSIRTERRLIENGELTPVQLAQRVVRVAPADLANRTMNRRRRRKKAARHAS